MGRGHETVRDLSHPFSTLSTTSGRPATQAARAEVLDMAQWNPLLSLNCWRNNKILRYSMAKKVEKCSSNQFSRLSTSPARGRKGIPSAPAHWLQPFTSDLHRPQPQPSSPLVGRCHHFRQQPNLSVSGRFRALHGWPPSTNLQQSALVVAKSWIRH